MANDQRVILLGEDVGRDGGVFRVTEGLLERFGPERLIDTPLSEVSVGVAIGMAAYGFRPVAEIQFMGFAYAALDQFFTHAARLRSRSRGRSAARWLCAPPTGPASRLRNCTRKAARPASATCPASTSWSPPGHTGYGLLLAAIRDPDPVSSSSRPGSIAPLGNSCHDGKALPLIIV